MVSVLSTKTMSSRFSQGFSFFGRSFLRDSDKVETSRDHAIVPCLKVHTDREVYRPGDLINLNITISIPEPSTSKGDHPDASSSFLIDSLSFEIKGIEKLDSQWFIIQKPQIDSKLKKGIFSLCFLDLNILTILFYISSYLKTNKNQHKNSRNGLIEWKRSGGFIIKIGYYILKYSILFLLVVLYTFNILFSNAPMLILKIKILAVLLSYHCCFILFFLIN